MITRYSVSEALELETFEAPRHALFLQNTSRPENAAQRNRAYHQRGKQMLRPRNSSWGAEEKPMPYFDTVKQYLLDLELSIVSEDVANSLVVVEDESRGLKNLVVDCEEPLLVFEQIIMPIPSNPGEMFRRLLQMNRCIVRGAFALDEEGTRVLYRNTMPLAHLDANEVEGTIDALSLALGEFASELIGFNEQ